MIENLELHINYTSKTKDGEATSWGVKWKVKAWNGKKIGCYDLIQIKRATARISRRAKETGREDMYSTVQRVADFCCGVIKAGGANISYASRGLRPRSPAVLQAAVPPTYKNVTPPTSLSQM